MKFFTKEASKALRTAKGELEWDRRWTQYKLHLKEIRPLLSKSWRRIAKTDFHDTQIFSFAKWHNGDFILNIDMDPLWKQPPRGICSLRFQRVQRIDVPEKVFKHPIIYTEVHARKNGAEFRGLCAHDVEFRIAAEKVDYVINYESGSL